MGRVQSVGLVPESEWIAVTNGRWDDQPQSLMNVGWGDLQLSVAADKIVFNTSERTGNIWLVKLEGRK